MVLTAYSALSLVIGFLATIAGAMRQHRHPLDISVEMSGPHDFAVRLGCARLAQLKRPPHPAPNVCDDRETPLMRGGTESALLLFLPM
jgi:hypothetical protein